MDDSKFWDVGPHDPLPVEATWHEFVRAAGGQVLTDLLGTSPSFENADYMFPSVGIVAELKEVQTEFLAQRSAREGWERLMERLVAEKPEWRPTLFGGDGKYPDWFFPNFARLARPPIGRILKKANSQIKQTKDHFGIAEPTGIVIFVNDGFTGLAPDIVQALAMDVLVNSYSSIDCLLYMTVNRYVAIPGSRVPQLIWHPTYSDRADDSLSLFVDDLGRKWFDFLEVKIGPFTQREEVQDKDYLRGAQSIVLPNERKITM